MSVLLPDSSAGCLVLNINLRYIGAGQTKIGIAASENMPIAELYYFVNTYPSPLGILNEYKAY